jgi:hypothetical protein
MCSFAPALVGDVGVAEEVGDVEERRLSERSCCGRDRRRDRTDEV